MYEKEILSLLRQIMFAEIILATKFAVFNNAVSYSYYVILCNILHLNLCLTVPSLTANRMNLTLTVHIIRLKFSYQSFIAIFYSIGVNFFPCISHFSYAKTAGFQYLINERATLFFADLIFRLARKSY